MERNELKNTVEGLRIRNKELESREEAHLSKIDNLILENDSLRRTLEEKERAFKEMKDSRDSLKEETVSLREWDDYNRDKQGIMSREIDTLRDMLRVANSENARLRHRPLESAHELRSQIGRLRGENSVLQVKLDRADLLYKYLKKKDEMFTVCCIGRRSPVVTDDSFAPELDGMRSRVHKLCSERLSLQLKLIESRKQIDQLRREFKDRESEVVLVVVIVDGVSQAPM
ncbi:TNFAIP3-interacting protein 3-like [Octopus sinensis]|uniref:TNFAIP3-interacting protein 3-like n=1 Tax=Octopus sinensis TaxID=2607531 RepID=A0A6P7U9A7_9MOLL|nr:TNFAIP3-interacting protein 3-like [Octopus sinensis]